MKKVLERWKNDQAVRTQYASEIQQLMSRSVIYELIYAWKGRDVLWTNLIEVREFYEDHSLTIVLFHYDRIGDSLQIYGSLMNLVVINFFIPFLQSLLSFRVERFSFSFFLWKTNFGWILRWRELTFESIPTVSSYLQAKTYKFLHKKPFNFFCASSVIFLLI